VLRVTLTLHQNRPKALIGQPEGRGAALLNDLTTNDTNDIPDRLFSAIKAATLPFFLVSQRGFALF
jgi:hypothetical protein